MTETSALSYLIVHSVTASSRPGDNTLSLFYFATKADSFDVV